MNQAHLGDIVCVTLDKLKDHEGIVVAIRIQDNHYQVRVATDDPTLFRYREYSGDEIELIECNHQTAILNE